MTPEQAERLVPGAFVMNLNTSMEETHKVTKVEFRTPSEYGFGIRQWLLQIYTLHHDAWLPCGAFFPVAGAEPTRKEISDFHSARLALRAAALEGMRDEG